MKNLFRNSFVNPKPKEIFVKAEFTATDEKKPPQPKWWLHQLIIAAGIMQLTPKAFGEIRNEQEIPINIDGPLTFISESWRIDDVKPLHFSTQHGEYELDFVLKKKVTNEVDNIVEVLFETPQDSVLAISIHAHVSTDSDHATCNVTQSMLLQNAMNTLELLKAAYVLKEIASASNKKVNLDFYDSLIHIWEKAFWIENCFSVSFTPGAMTREEESYVNLLYYSLSKSIPIRGFFLVPESFFFEKGFPIEQINESINQNMAIRYGQDFEIEILGVKLLFWGEAIIYNRAFASVRDTIKDGEEKLEVLMKDADEKASFTTLRIFLEEKDVEKTDTASASMSKYWNAKTIAELEKEEYKTKLVPSAPDSIA